MVNSVNEMYSYPYEVQNSQNTNYSAQTGYTSSPMMLKDTFEKEQKNNTIIGRIYNGLKNITHLGVGSNKVKQAITKAENGEISEEQAFGTITKYKNSQANSAQIVGDALSISASFGTFFGIRTFLKKLNAKIILKDTSNLEELSNNFGKSKNILKTIKSNKKLVAISAISAAIVGGFVKKLALRINRIGSNEYKVDKKDFNNLATEKDRIEYKYEKKYKRRLRRKANRRNFLSGAINGLMMPLITIGGAVVGVPLYLAGNLLNRYFVGNTTEENKSFGGFVENLKTDSILHGALAVGTAIPLIKKGKWTNVFDKNLENAVNKLKGAKLEAPFKENITAYDELDRILMGSQDVNRIINSTDSIEEKIKKLIEENIFAVKFKQIKNDGSALCKALKEDCPASRTFDEAKKLITDNFGSEYEVTKLLGVGTVAETYLAKDKNGKEVCIKILKEGITKEKITADKNKFEKIIENHFKDDIKKQEHLKRNLEDLYNSISKEINLENEKTAAEELAQYTSVAKVVKPIKVVNNMYVMEKADGISLESLINLNTAVGFKEAIEKGIPIENLFKNLDKENPFYKMLSCNDNYVTKNEAKEILQRYIEKIQSRTPQYGDIKLSKDDIKFLIEEYQQVLIEQFNKVEKNGKTQHADIHAGNIFIDINALRNRRSDTISSTATMISGKRNSNQIFTLIDTGNTIKMDQAQALRAINLTSYIKRANVKDITEYVLEDAILPKGMTKEEATTIISDKLKKIFFDTSTSCEKVTNESIVNMTTNIMREHNIIPADTALNLNKARISANDSLSGLYDSMSMLYMNELISKISTEGQSEMIVLSKLPGTILEALKDVAVLERKNTTMQAAQEKINLKNMTAEMRNKYKHNPNNLATNSEDLLTYELKQSITKNIELSSF
ncbi:MAG: AarF/UbiB family protein [bacterium]|nr:AarF/UbiB family protein [bacterium]